MGGRGGRGRTEGGGGGGGGGRRRRKRQEEHALRHLKQGPNLSGLGKTEEGKKREKRKQQEEEEEEEEEEVKRKKEDEALALLDKPPQDNEESTSGRESWGRAAEHRSWGEQRSWGSSGARAATTWGRGGNHRGSWGGSGWSRAADHWGSRHSGWKGEAAKETGSGWKADAPKETVFYSKRVNLGKVSCTHPSPPTHSYSCLRLPLTAVAPLVDFLVFRESTTRSIQFVCPPFSTRKI